MHRRPVAYRVRCSNSISVKSFNRHLEAIGFERARVRLKCIVRYAYSKKSRKILFPARDLCALIDTPCARLRSSAGTWVFDHRRWLNPNISTELQQLRQVNLIFRNSAAELRESRHPTKPCLRRPTVSCRSVSPASSSATSPPSSTPWPASRSVQRPLRRDAGLANRVQRYPRAIRRNACSRFRAPSRCPHANRYIRT